MIDFYFKNKKNNDSSFTELFSLLKRYEKLEGESTTLLYESSELKYINQHIDNAINTLLQGLQDLGQLIGVSSQSEEIRLNEFKYIGFFISAITNLTEALNDLRTDTEYSLKQRGVQNY